MGHASALFSSIGTVKNTYDTVKDMKADLTDANKNKFEKGLAFNKHLADWGKEYKADGIIVESNKFCEYWSYERTIDTIVLGRDFGIPVCSIEKEYINSASGQLRTRFQAFVESIEIKQIQEGK